MCDTMSRRTFGGGQLELRPNKATVQACKPALARGVRGPSCSTLRIRQAGLAMRIRIKVSRCWHHLADAIVICYAAMRHVTCVRFVEKLRQSRMKPRLVGLEERRALLQVPDLHSPSSRLMDLSASHCRCQRYIQAHAKYVTRPPLIQYQGAFKHIKQVRYFGDNLDPWPHGIIGHQRSTPRTF